MEVYYCFRCGATDVVVETEEWEEVDRTCPDCHEKGLRTVTEMMDTLNNYYLIDKPRDED